MRWLVIVVALGLWSGCERGGDPPADTGPDADADADLPRDADAARDADADADRDQPPRDGDLDDDGGDDGGPPPELAEVAHDRELRGVWVATVANINFPSRTGLSSVEQQAELRAILDRAESLRINAVVFQVRPEGDALYSSELEPWSRFLSGTQGVDPGYDPLEYLIERAHPRNIEVHAWLNPYRAKSNQASAAVSPHLSVTHPELMRRYGSYLWMDPGAEAVQAQTLAVVTDLVTRYDLDGVHFDDYFYPYPDGDTPFPDDSTYQAYLEGGGALGRDDWRRDNVNRLVAQVAEAIASVKPEVRFGISPFGIYRPGNPPGISGLDQYAEIYADPLEWLRQGSVEYLAPQLYWPTTQTAQAYGALLEWWAGETSRAGRTLFVGNYLSQLGSSSAWTVDELRAQMDLTRAQRGSGALGNIFFHVEPFQTNQEGIADVFRDEYYQRPALTPRLSTAGGGPLEPPEVTALGRDLTLRSTSERPLRAFVVYRDVGEGVFEIDRVLAASRVEVTLEPGRWAISAVDRAGIESLGVVVELEGP